MKHLHAPLIVVTTGTPTPTQPVPPLNDEHENVVTVVTTGGRDDTLGKNVEDDDRLTAVPKRVAVGVGEHAIRQQGGQRPWQGAEQAGLRTGRDSG